MTATAPETIAPRVGTLDVRTSTGPLTVTAERTECEHLWIVPYIGPAGLDGSWCLAHGPTGRLVTGTLDLDVRELRDMARLLADMPLWASSDPQAFRGQAEHLAQRVTAARDAVTR